MGKAGSLFEAGFPDWAGVRKGVAHRGDFSKSPKRTSEHRTDDDISGVIEHSTGTFMGQTFINTRFTTSVEGKFRQLDMTGETLGKLQAVLDMTFEALTPAAAALNPFPPR